MHKSVEVGKLLNTYHEQLVITVVETDAGMRVFVGTSSFVEIPSAGYGARSFMHPNNPKLPVGNKQTPLPFKDD